MANMLTGGKTPILSASQLELMGFAIVAYPTLVTYAVAQAAQRALGHLLDKGSPAGFREALDFAEFNRLIGLEELRARESSWYQPNLR